MTTTYTPKKPYMTKSRIQKDIKDLLIEQKEDRKLALETYESLKEDLDRGADRDSAIQEVDLVSKMVDCLKVAQSARNNSIKLLVLAEKMLQEKPTGTTTGGKKDTSTGNPLFN